MYEKTLIRKGATIGANATIVCNITIGKYAFIAAGTVVTKNVPDYAFVVGVPGIQKGWMSRHGHQLTDPDKNGIFTCPESSLRYQVNPDGCLICLDIEEDQPLPEELSIGTISYKDFKQHG